MHSEDKVITTIHHEVISVEEATKRFDVSPIIKRFGTWAVTTYGVECLSSYYAFEFYRVKETDWISHMKQKKWVVIDDFANALHYARKLQERRKDFMKDGKPL